MVSVQRVGSELYSWSQALNGLLSRQDLHRQCSCLFSCEWLHHLLIAASLRGTDSPVMGPWSLLCLHLGPGWDPQLVQGLCSVVWVNLIFLHPSFSFNEETALVVEVEEVSAGVVSCSYRGAEWGGFYTEWISLHGHSLMCVWCLLFSRKIRIRKRAKMKSVALKWPLQRTAPPQGWWTCMVSGRRSDPVPLSRCCESVNQHLRSCTALMDGLESKWKTPSDTHLVPWTSLLWMY